MSLADVGRWVTWSRRRLTGAATTAVTVASVAAVVVLATKMSAPDDTSLVAEPSSTVTTAPSYVATPLPSPSPSETLFQSSEATAAADRFTDAWLDGADLTDLAYPTLLETITPPEPGLYLTSPAVALESFGGAGIVSTETLTSEGSILLTLVLTDEIGWVVRDMVVR